jgi:hypothetical protein
MPHLTEAGLPPEIGDLEETRIRRRAVEAAKMLVGGYSCCFASARLQISERRPRLNLLRRRYGSVFILFRQRSSAKQRETGQFGSPPHILDAPRRSLWRCQELDAVLFVHIGF